MTIADENNKLIDHTLESKQPECKNKCTNYFRLSGYFDITIK